MFSYIEIEEISNTHRNQHIKKAVKYAISFPGAQKSEIATVRTSDGEICHSK